MFLSLILMLAADPFAAPRADIPRYCASIGQGKACESKQKSEMGYFVTILAGFPVTQAEALACMKKGKRGKFVDWTVATPCLRATVKGRRIGG
jgi:hypothetical protein